MSVPNQSAFTRAKLLVLGTLEQVVKLVQS